MDTSQLEPIIKRYILPIYAPKESKKPQQIGTGFTVTTGNKVFLVTAAHVLFGHSFNESPANKAIINNKKKFKQLSEISRVINYNKDYDIAYLEMTTDLDTLCFSIDNFKKYDSLGEQLSIAGFLFRDYRFSMQNKCIKNKMFIYTGRKKKGNDGKIIFEYTRRKNKDVITGLQRNNPKPRGLSGCPILDTSTTLKENKPIIAGIFIEQSHGEGRGVSIEYVQQFMNDEIDKDRVS